MAELSKAKQEGIGTIDTYESHGKTLYRFVPKEPNEKSLRKIKMHVARMGYKKGLPKEIEAFFAKALAEGLEVEISCEFFDKGAGKPTSIGTKLISYKFVKK